MPRICFIPPTMSALMLYRCGRARLSVLSDSLNAGVFRNEHNQHSGTYQPSLHLRVSIEARTKFLIPHQRRSILANELPSEEPSHCQESRAKQCQCGRLGYDGGGGAVIGARY